MCEVTWPSQPQGRKAEHHFWQSPGVRFPGAGREPRCFHRSGGSGCSGVPVALLVKPTKGTPPQEFIKWKTSKNNITAPSTALGQQSSSKRCLSGTRVCLTRWSMALDSTRRQCSTQQNISFQGVGSQFQPTVFRHAFCFLGRIWREKG